MEDCDSGSSNFKVVYLETPWVCKSSIVSLRREGGGLTPIKGELERTWTCLSRLRTDECQCNQVCRYQGLGPKRGPLLVFIGTDPGGDD